MILNVSINKVNKTLQPAKMAPDQPRVANCVAISVPLNLCHVRDNYEIKEEMMWFFKVTTTNHFVCSTKRRILIIASDS